MPNKWKKNLYFNFKYQIKILYNNSKNQLMDKIRWISLNKISNNLKINNKYLNKINSSNINNSNKKISFKT